MPKVMVKVEVETGGDFSKQLVVGVERANEIPGMGTSLGDLTEKDIDLAQQAMCAAIDSLREQVLTQLDTQRAIARARSPQGGPSRDHVPAGGGI